VQRSRTAGKSAGSGLIRSGSTSAASSAVCKDAPGCAAEFVAVTFAPLPRGNRTCARIAWLLDVIGKAPHVRQANPAGGCPLQFTQRVVSSAGRRRQDRLRQDVASVVLAGLDLVAEDLGELDVLG
jgi:hypothetical protein